jgi:hypothetical protein
MNTHQAAPSWGRTNLALAALSVFIPGNLVTVLTAGYPLSLAARTVTGAVYGLIISPSRSPGPPASSSPRGRSRRSDRRRSPEGHRRCRDSWPRQ